MVATFLHWKASSSAVFLQNKVVLTPEIPDRYGLLYNKRVSDENLTF